MVEHLHGKHIATLKRKDASMNKDFLNRIRDWNANLMRYRKRADAHERNPNIRSNGFNHLDKIYAEHYTTFIEAGYHSALAHAAAFYITDQTLCYRVYGITTRTPHKIESGFEKPHNLSFLAHHTPPPTEIKIRLHTDLPDKPTIQEHP